MKILAIEPYLGGSHNALLEGWSSRSRHQWDVLSLPANKSSRRIWNSTLGFAEEVSRRLAGGQRWDALFCSDMLNLAEFRGLGMSFNICRGTLGSLAVFTAIRNALSRVSRTKRPPSRP